MSDTHIFVILDRSGSMNSIRDDVIGGFNALLAAQQSESGVATLTLVQFDSQNPYEVIHRFAPIGEVPPLDATRFVPRGGTPLLDALGRGILDLEATLAARPEGERPAQVVFAIFTDGAENASREFDRSRVTALIREKRERDGWHIVFQSADESAIQEAVQLGVASDSAQLYAKNAQGTRAAFRTLSKSVSDLRRGKKRRIGFAAPEETPAGR